MKNLTLLATALLLFTAACRQKAVQTVNVINLIDLSDSHDSVTTGWYRNIAADIVLGNLGQTSCFTAIPIDHGSESSCEELYCRDFGSTIYANEFAGLQADELAEKHHKDSVKSAGKAFAFCFDNACRSRKGFAGGTDITGALKVAKKYKKDNARNIIIVMADMLHCVPEQGIDFEKKLNADKDIDSLIAKMEQIDLSGFEILVLTGKQERINTVKYAAVQKLWERYLSSCNARLVSYSSGSVTQIAQILKGGNTHML